MNVIKVIARRYEREEVESSEEETQRFIVEEIRPEFDDEHIIAIKFVTPFDGESVWILSPSYLNSLIEYKGFDTLAGEIPPEILELNALEKFEKFYNRCLRRQSSEVTDLDLLKKFLHNRC